jgi:hypothetical protein
MHSLPPAQEGAAPGWYADPVAADMLRWWNGSEWSETEFKLARPLVKTKTRRDLLLGPVGRRGSVINVAMCTGLVVFGIVFALNVHPVGDVPLSGSNTIRLCLTKISFNPWHPVRLSLDPRTSPRWHGACCRRMSFSPA